MERRLTLRSASSKTCAREVKEEEGGKIVPVAPEVAVAAFPNRTVSGEWPDVLCSRAEASLARTTESVAPVSAMNVGGGACVATVEKRGCFCNLIGIKVIGETTFRLDVTKLVPPPRQERGRDVRGW